MSRLFGLVLAIVLLFACTATAQFQFFDQFFGGNGGQQQQGQQQQQQQRNVASDSNWYRSTWEHATCTDYLCPDTLACVAFPHHCPCQYEDVEDKSELGDGIAICASRGGFKQGETLRKIELARKGLL